MVRTQHSGRRCGAGAVAAFGVGRLAVHVAIGTGRGMSKATLKFALSDLSPRAFCMLLGATHTGSQVLQTVHVQPSTAVAGRKNALALSECLHPMDHLCFERTAIVFFLRLAGALAGSREQVGGRVWDGHRRVHHGLQFCFVHLRRSCVIRRWWRWCLCGL